MYLKNIQDNCFLNEELLQKITKAHKALMELMLQTCEKMKEISNIWKQVHEKSVKYFDMHNTSQTYNILSKVMNAWSETEKQQVEILNVYVREYFRYIKNEYHSMHEMGEFVETNQGIYQKALEKLDNIYGGYLNCIISEYERLRFLNGKRHKDNIDVYLRKLGDCIVSLHVSLADRLTEFSFMKDEEEAQPSQLDKNAIIENQDKKEEEKEEKNNDNNN